MIMRPCWGQNGPNGKPVKCVPVETRIIQHPKVWEASGHVGGFNDPMVDDKETKQRFRADHLQGAFAGANQDDAAALQSTRAMGASVFVPPRITVIASSPNEAIEILEADRKLQKAIGIRKIRLHQTKPEEAAAGGFIDFGDGEKYYFISAVSMDDLKVYFDQIPSPYSGKRAVLTAPRQFNLMFHTYTGANATEDDKVYLRPETAQGIFVQFKNVVDTTRVKIPFGIGNTGTSFRNEITPRNFTFRSREFEQAELEFFCHPEESEAWYKFWRDYRMQWWQSIGLAGDNLILREHDKDELSHYSVGTSDVEYRFPFTAPGYGELEGIAHRGCYDLTQHQQHSGVKMEYNDTERGEILPNGGRRGERYIPHCIEPAAGLDRGVLALICEAYTRDDSRPSPEFMKFHPRIAPIKAAVFPLVAKDGMPEVAEKLHADLSARFWRLGPIEMDEKQSIGKRYARMDEAGCPYCFTVDGDTMKDQTVTCRDRDTGTQTRISIDKVGDFLAEKLGV
jgi:glycyl-tRNA synthetase